MSATVTDITRIRAVAVRVERRAIAGGCNRDVARLLSRRGTKPNPKGAA